MKKEIENGTKKRIGWKLYEYFFGLWILVDNF